MTSREHFLDGLRVLAFAAALLSGAPAGAQPATDDEAQAMRDFFAGALEIDVPASTWSATRYYAPDHTYRETGADGEVLGTWAIDNGRICATPDRPLGHERATTYCNLGLGKRIGETWRDSDPVTHNTVVFHLAAGRP